LFHIYLITKGYSQEAVEQSEDEVKVTQLPIWSPDEEEFIFGTDEVERTFRTNANLNRLVQECEDLTSLLSSPVKIPTVRYGRTNLQMPIVTLGCMRFQQSWNRGGTTPITSPSQIEQACQDNLVNILRHAIHCGVNHIETARGYGCSEMQIGMALKVLFDEGVCKREDLIIQTKGGISSTTTKAEYKSSILQQIATSGVDYVDLFSVHGVNTMDHVDWLFNHGEERGNLIDAVRELKEEGKIRWIGFSTHAPAHVTKVVIESDAFDYMNGKRCGMCYLHAYFVSTSFMDFHNSMTQCVKHRFCGL
jgi:predicted aldo/keto reductase-like oxidoreductase